ncbi:MAG: hypothetical protein JW873_00275 [Candidatus Saganbacteria bacterium]|nr:hypothetical protein [Candidatus Saganbacteria bacterium]
MPAIFLLLLAVFGLCPFNAADARTHRAKLNDGVLVIAAPRAYEAAGKKNFADDNNAYGVALTYGGLTIEANRAAVDLRRDVIELAGGFRGTFEGYALSGDHFRIDPASRNFSGENLRLGYLTAYLQAGELRYNGEKITMDNVTAAPFDQPLFSADLGQLEIYPGYMLARRNVFRAFFVPCYYIPLYFNDQRRSYFPLPFPAFEARQDIYHGGTAAVHSNYFFDPKLFGDVSLRQSELDGAGLGIQQVVRLSDNHQLNFNYAGWQKAPAQTKLSYVFNYFRVPPPPGPGAAFQERAAAVQAVARLEPLWAVGADYSQNEDFNRARLDRYPDLLANARLKGLLYDHTYTLTPYYSYGRIREKKIWPENGAPQEVDRNYERKGLGFNGSYYLETPYIKPYVNRALLSLDFLHNDYDPGSAQRDRLASSLTVRRPLLNFAGLYYELVLTKVLLNSGRSPFFYEEYGWQLLDNAALDLYLQTDRLIGGAQYVYDLSNSAAYNEIYYAGIKALGDSFVTIRRDRRMRLWELAFMKKEQAF